MRKRASGIRVPDMKQILLKTADLGGLNRWARHHTRRRLLGLCYHGVAAEAGPVVDSRTRIAVTLRQFEAQMRHLRQNWTPVTSSQVRDAVIGGRPLPDRAVHVSFDDGYRNNLTVAAPVLSRYEIPATVFVTSGFLDTQKILWPLELHERLAVAHSSLLMELAQRLKVTLPCTLAPEDCPQRAEQVLPLLDAVKRLPPAPREKFLDELRAETGLDLSVAWRRELYEPLAWSELSELARHGLEIGVHTVTHPNLALLTQAEQRYEIGMGRERIEQVLGEPFRCTSFAYPFGSRNDYSDEVVATVKELGFQLAFTLEECRNRETLDPFRIHRICIHRELSQPSFLALTSGLRNN